ncbi:MAG: helix-turn-helix transcriptional regulator [Corynebacterium sp.]|uniref:PadR family transcriptional regulator n=1 Tax=Corynebacterium sp. TaxID=1720 RepID=UPI0026DCD6DE|nr:helix-turn-helix transcriptional regulator [Corynebacterium sp.]MDO5097314.1 helix-turn-helix transcriptional regulator [Corynebacterium sp.]
MSIKFALLALLSNEPRTASGLQQEFLERTAGTQKLNIGQVSQTLSRLERDLLIQTAGSITGPNGHHADSYTLTEVGTQALQNWWNDPVTRALSDRDELVTKIILATTNPELNFLDILDTQRAAILGQLRTLNAHSRTLPHTRNAERLHIERRIFDLEAEARWLDRVESLAADTANPANSHRDGEQQ